MKKRFFILPIISSILPVHALDLYVSPDGKDSNNGSANEPLATLHAAQQKARSVAGKDSVTVHVADGVYYFQAPLTFTAEDSGTAQFPIVYQSTTENGAVLSGGSALNLTWKATDNGVFTAQTTEGIEIDQLFIDGKNQRMARYPNYDPAKKAEAYQGHSSSAFSVERAKNWENPEGGYIHAMHRARWGGYHYRITGKDDKGDVTYEGGWQNNRQMGMHKDQRMVENIFEELDAKGEWYHNGKNNTLYFIPPADVDLNNALAEVVRLRHIIEFNGTESAPVKHITLKGFTVRHAARTFMDTKEQLLRSDWAIYRGGAYTLTGTENIQILDSTFDQVGGNAIFVNNYNRNVLVKGCHIVDAGASGICFVGDPDAVRNPLFEYREKNDLSKLDLTPGPKTNNYPADSTVEDCLIHGIGTVEKQPAGVQISMAQGITVRDSSIYDCARSGINISEGTWGGHLIERCDVFDTVLETHDHGSFNSWGRDRYWRADHNTASQEAVDNNPDLPFLDAMKTTVIRDSRWRCDHGWDIDLDDGSTNYDIYNNLLLARGLKLREGYRRHAWNNITVNNGLHPHVWFKGSKDKVYSNIFMAAHHPARMNEPYTQDTMVDRNFYFVANQQVVINRSKALDWDNNSAFGDPEFISPEKGNYQVKETSPALETGFKNFPMDQFGVKKPSLKKIARTPELPKLVSKLNKAPKAPKAQAESFKWKGITLTDLSGEEFSAYGVSKEESGVVVSNVNPKGLGKKIGLQNGDVIQNINGQKTQNVKALRVVISKLKGDTTFTVIRNQEKVELKASL